MHGLHMSSNQVDWTRQAQATTIWMKMNAALNQIDMNKCDDELIAGSANNRIKGCGNVHRTVCPTWCPKHTLVKFRKITLMLLADYVFCFGLLTNTKPKLTNQLSWPIDYSVTGIDVWENFAFSLLYRFVAFWRDCHIRSLCSLRQEGWLSAAQVIWLADETFTLHSFGHHLSLYQQVGQAFKPISCRPTFTKTHFLPPRHMAHFPYGPLLHYSQCLNVPPDMVTDQSKYRESMISGRFTNTDNQLSGELTTMASAAAGNMTRRQSNNLSTAHKTSNT